MTVVVALHSNIPAPTLSRGKESDDTSPNPWASSRNWEWNCRVQKRERVLQSTAECYEIFLSIAVFQIWQFHNPRDLGFFSLCMMDTRVQCIMYNPASRRLQQQYCRRWEAGLGPGNEAKDSLWLCHLNVCTGECQWGDLPLIKKMMTACRSLFPVVSYAFTTVPSYCGGQVGFVLASLNKVSMYAHICVHACVFQFCILHNFMSKWLTTACGH